MSLFLVVVFLSRKMRSISDLYASDPAHTSAYIIIKLIASLQGFALAGAPHPFTNHVSRVRLVLLAIYQADRRQRTHALRHHRQMMDRN